MTEQNTIDERSQLHQKDLEALAKYRLMDDDFMRCVLKKNSDVSKYILQVVTGIPDLELIEQKTQEDMKRVTGARSICLDVYATDSKGRIYDLEFQRSSTGAIPKRARYHSSVLDIENLNTNDQFSQLPETFTIFITEHDYFHQKQPFYLINRTVQGSNDLFGDEEHILYVNGAYTGDDEIGHLMHDLKCSEPDDMYSAFLSKITWHYKKTEGGQEEVLSYMDEQRREAEAKGNAEGNAEGSARTALNIIEHLKEEMHISLEEARKLSGVSSETYQEALRLAKRDV